MPAAEDLAPYLVPTWFIDCDNPAVRRRADEVAAGAASDEERSARLFYAVRDGIWYDPYSITSDPGHYRASTVLAQPAATAFPRR